MVIYVGYGFNVNDVQCDAWLDLLANHDADLYDGFVSDCEENYGSSSHETLLENVKEYIEEGSTSVAEYLCDIINSGEKERAGTDYIVSCYDNFLVFDSIRFADDSPRTRYVPSQEAFIRMIQKYIPTDNLSFGNVYDGEDWIDPSFFMD